MANEQTPPQSPRVDYVGRSGVYPVSGPWPPGNVPIVGQGELAHPEERRRRGLARFRNKSTALLGLGCAMAGAYFLYQRKNRSMAMLARDVMTRNPACCTPHTTLDDVAKLMVHNHCGEIPVVDAFDRLIGVVTDRDIVCRVVAEGKNPMGYTAETCMSTPVVTVAANAGLQDVVSTMEQHQVRRVLVVDERGSCVGIISQADVAWTRPERDVAELVREVSRDTGDTSQ